MPLPYFHDYKNNLEDIPALTTLINSAYRGETSKKVWTTEAHLLEGNEGNIAES